MGFNPFESSLINDDTIEPKEENPTKDLVEVEDNNEEEDK